MGRRSLFLVLGLCLLSSVAYGFAVAASGGPFEPGLLASSTGAVKTESGTPARRYPTYTEFLETKATLRDTSSSREQFISTSRGTTAHGGGKSRDARGEHDYSALLDLAVKTAAANKKSGAMAKTKSKTKQKGILGGLAAVGGMLLGALFNQERAAADVEDCTACRFVWLQVEMDVGESKMEEHIYDSFTRRCMEAQKAPIFQPACDDMFQSIDDMISDYIQDFTVNQMCEASRICR